MKKFLCGSNYFFKEYSDYKVHDLDYILIDDNLEKDYDHFIENKTDYFIWKKNTPEWHINNILETGFTLDIGHLLIPESAEELGITIDHLKQLQDEVEKYKNIYKGKYEYNKIIYDSYIENNSFTLTKEQRDRAYKSYRESRRLDCITVFNTFTNYQRIKKLPEVDILIWTTSLIRYRQLGYRLKLFCTCNDLEFLRENHLYELYDDIDTDFFENLKIDERVNQKYFWSTRKIEAVYYERCVLNEEAIYSDVDIYMRAPFDLSGDGLVWSPEEATTNNSSIYVPWRNLSKPKGYQMPQYMLETKDAYNGGIWYFKNKEVYEEYYKQYYAFAINNPCEIKLHKSRGDDVKDLEINNDVWACNGEQRVLKAVLDHYKQDIHFVMSERKKGWSKQGVHFFYYRIAWRFLHDKDYDPAPDAISMLNLTILECLTTLKNYNINYYNFWTSKDWLKDFESKLDLKNKIYPIDNYY